MPLNFHLYAVALNCRISALCEHLWLSPLQDDGLLVFRPFTQFCRCPIERMTRTFYTNLTFPNVFIFAFVLGPLDCRRPLFYDNYALLSLSWIQPKVRHKHRVPSSGTNCQHDFYSHSHLFSASEFRTHFFLDAKKNLTFHAHSDTHRMHVDWKWCESCLVHSAYARQWRWAIRITNNGTCRIELSFSSSTNTPTAASVLGQIY